MIRTVLIVVVTGVAAGITGAVLHYSALATVVIATVAGALASFVLDA
jgi:hypothetical protein